MEYNFIAIRASSAPGLKHHVAEDFYGQSEDSGDHFACISSGKKSEKKPARSKDFEGECDDAWQELRKKKIPDILCLQFFVLFRFLPILLLPPERLHEVGCKQSFHSVLILSLLIISVFLFCYGGGGGVGGARCNLTLHFLSRPKDATLLWWRLEEGLFRCRARTLTFGSFFRPSDSTLSRVPIICQLAGKLPTLRPALAPFARNQTIN